MTSRKSTAAEFYAMGIEKLYIRFPLNMAGGLTILSMTSKNCCRTVQRQASRPKKCAWLWSVGPMSANLPWSTGLLGVERVVANPVAGTTRDSIDSPFQVQYQRYVLIDTAGIRRKGKVSQALESTVQLRVESHGSVPCCAHGAGCQ